MTSVNRVILTGRIAKPAKRLCRPDGSTAIEFALELDDSEAALPGSTTVLRRPARSLIDIVAIGAPARFDLDQFQAGQALHVEGRLHQRSWRTPEGRNRTRVEVIATDLRTIEQTSDPLSNERRRP
jgi:single-stranded DNA-binding protein